METPCCNFWRALKTAPEEAATVGNGDGDGSLAEDAAALLTMRCRMRWPISRWRLAAVRGRQGSKDEARSRFGSGSTS
eukprot:14988982-Alexandrium_andersonii.AAC.1